MVTRSGHRGIWSRSWSDYPGDLETNALRRDVDSDQLNHDFVDYLRSTLPDPRIMVIHGSAIDVEEALLHAGAARADYVISGIPFSTMPAAEREAALNKARAVLDPQGLFLVYQFSSSVLTDLRRIFHNVTRRFEPLNILPAHLYFCATGPGFDGGN